MEKDRGESIEKLRELLHEIDFCMLTTIADGKLRSRPMSTQKFEFDGDLWFFTDANTHKVEEIEADSRVCVAYSQPDDNKFVSVSGQGEISNDRAKMEELWNPILKAWFPEGLGQPTLRLLRVRVEEAEYWDSSSSTVVQLAGFVKAMVTGQQIDPGDHDKVRL